MFDHDFSQLAEGIAIPHAIYDVQKNTAYVNIGTTKETSEFACDSIRRWWYHRGRYDYPGATSILLLVDSGGSNSYRHYIFKEDLQRLSDKIGIEIRVAHYPPYASKWNPIEHRLLGSRRKEIPLTACARSASVRHPAATCRSTRLPMCTPSVNWTVSCATIRSAP